MTVSNAKLLAAAARDLSAQLSDKKSRTITDTLHEWNLCVQQAGLSTFDFPLKGYTRKSQVIADLNRCALQLEEMDEQTFTPAQPAPFGALVRQTAATYNVQMRFAAMMVHTGNYETLRRGAALIAFISDRKGEYVAAHPDKVTRGGTITDQEHFTAFILSGVWL